VDAPAIDPAVRLQIYAGLRDTSEVPTTLAIAEALGVGIGDVEASLHRLHEAHVLVLVEGTTEVRMALPFAARATPFAVHVGDRRWWANCAWDAYAIPAALGAEDAVIDTGCPDCGEVMRLEVRAGEAREADALIHFLVPASRWWDDIVFT
jgi:Alkylmercury lyase